MDDGIDPSTTNKTARHIAGFGFIASVLMIGLDGAAWYEANEVLVTALLTASVGSLGFPTWRRTREAQARYGLPAPEVDVDA